MELFQASGEPLDASGPYLGLQASLVCYWHLKSGRCHYPGFPASLKKLEDLGALVWLLDLSQFPHL